LIILTKTRGSPALILLASTDNVIKCIMPHFTA